jgi:spore germination cell wall hydrolase CwlJ-like protein
MEIDEYVMSATKIEGVQPFLSVKRSESRNSLKARYIEAEAGNQGIDGKRRVYAVLNNRVESPRFPDTVEGVLYQKGQFECVSNGSIDRVTVSDETLEAIRLEDENPSDTEVLFFTAGKYNDYCIPMYKLGDHFFGR